MDKKILQTRMALGEVMDQERKKQDLSIRELAEKAGIQHPQYIRVSKGSINYTIDTLVKVLDVLGLEITLTKKDGN